MLKFRSGVGVVFTILILAAVGVSFWLRRPASTLDKYLEATPPPLPDTVFVGEELVPPVPAPEFDLINYTGERITNDTLKGKLVLVSFAYTSCPDVCPMLFSRYMGVQKEFAEAIGQDVELVFISVDPEVDTPERLKSHVEVMRGKWFFLTEDLATMQDVWTGFRVRVEKEGALVGHSNLTYLIDEQGLIKVRYVGLPPASVFISDIQKLLKG